MKQKIILRTVGFVGFAVFTAFFSLTYWAPDSVETFASEFLQREAAKQIDRTIDSIQPPTEDSGLSRLATSIFEMNQEKIDGLKEDLRTKTHERMAESLALIMNLDCECRAKYASVFEQGLQTDIALLQAANDAIVEFIQSTYMYTFARLKADIRIFTASNAAVFLFLLLLSIMKPRAINHLFVPGILLVSATLICSYFYIFQQNWLLTIIFNDFLGFAYLAYLGVVFLFLLDISLNRGRVTSGLGNSALNALGSVFSLSPC